MNSLTLDDLLAIEAGAERYQQDAEENRDFDRAAVYARVISWAQRGIRRLERQARRREQLQRFQAAPFRPRWAR
jgi:hypothetical protein